MYKNIKKNDIEIPQNIETYLGPKGYTIFKKDLPMRTQLYIKEQLTIKPYTPGAPVSSGNSFPCYRESNNKLYLPRYFGIELFGLPKRYNIPDGLPINLEFTGMIFFNMVITTNSGFLLSAHSKLK